MTILTSRFLHILLVQWFVLLMALAPQPAPAVSTSVWVDDATPLGATLMLAPGASLSGTDEAWTWIRDNPLPLSGTVAHQSTTAAGAHQHYFYDTPLENQLTVNAGDRLFAYIYLDPVNSPSQIMLQWNDGSWEHRAYWGANSISWGVDGTNSRRYMGALPPAGQWVRLEVLASQVGLEGRSLNGMAFTLHGGRATWDQAGKDSGASVNSPPTVNLIAPANGATYTAPAAITLTATATDTDGTIAKVEFYQGATLVGTATAAPYAITLNGVAAGTYSYTAKAYDNVNASTVSGGASVTVGNSTYSTTVWVEDAVPIGGALASDQEAWTWTAASPAPFSGSLAHQSGIVAGVHQHYFYDTPAGNQLSISAGDTLFAYVYLDPANPPSEVMLQWNDGSWERRAYWGSDNITWGANGTASRRYMGPLPPVGQWVRLEVPASVVGLEGRSLNGMAFTLFNGRATWDQAGKVGAGSGNAVPSVTLTAPANGASYTASATITLTANAADSDGTISQVEFYNGATLLNTDNASPYTYTWSGVAAGSYALTAKAYDNSGAITTSNVVNVTVNTPTNVAPNISSVSATPQTLLDTATSQLQVVASDPDAKPSPLSYSWSIVSGGGSLSSSTLTNPVYTPANVSAPTSAVVKVTVSDGAATTSQSITLTVNDTPVVATVTITYYHNDALGSPIAATDASGNLLWRESYRPYGERLDNQAAATTNPLWYTGKRQDPETGLVYMGARYYNPALGRFLSIDPVEPDENNLHSLNRYAYANNNPYKFTDPDGQMPVLVPFVLAWMGGGAAVTGGVNASIQYTTQGEVRWGGVGGVADAAGDGVILGPVFGFTAGRSAGIAGAVAKTGIQANKAAGDAFERAIGTELRATHKVVAPQVTIRTPSGKRTRVDFVTRDGTQIGCVECKASATAPLTRNQAAGFPEIQQSGGVVVGKGKPGVPGGTVIPPGTQVTIRRP